MGSQSNGEKKASIRKLIQALSETEQTDIERKALRRLLTPEQFAECIELQSKLKASGREVSLGVVAIKRGHVTRDVLAAGIQTLRRSLGLEKSLTHQTSHELEAIVEGSGDVSSDVVDLAGVDEAVKAAQSKAAAGGGLRGRQFGSFTLEKQLGAGPLGETYTGRRVGSSVPTAVKVFEIDRLEAMGLPNLLFDRMRIAGQIKHDGLVQAVGCGRSPDSRHYYYAMELIEGVNLDTLMQRRKRLDEKTALAIAISVAKGLDAAHGKGVIHGNLKPSNVLIATGGIVRVCDTGLPRSSEYMVNRYLQGEVVKCKPRNMAFIAPELIDGQNLQTSADTYSIGLLLCYMLSGRIPFAGTPDQIVKLISGESNVLECLEDVPVQRETKLVIETMVNRVPGWRYEDMTELIGALRGSLNSLIGLQSQAIRRSDSGVMESVPRADDLVSADAALLDDEPKGSGLSRIAPADDEDPFAKLLAGDGPPRRAAAAAVPGPDDENLDDEESQERQEPAEASGNTALLAMLEESNNEEFQWQSGVFPGAGSAVMRSSPNLLAVTPESFIGRSVGDWELQKILGYGIVADMYLGRNVQTGQVAAVKVFLKQILSSKAAVLRFNSRCRVSIKIDHANMLKAYDFGQSKDGYCFFAMEYLSGRSLKRLIRRNGFIPERMALGIVLFAARGLMSAHERGIIHGNLKPSNILVNRQGVVKICDTGTPRSAEIVVDEALVKELPKELKPEAVAYIPPEIVIGAGDLQPQTDVYGLGMILYHMLTGRVPFKGTVPQIIQTIQRGETPRFVTADEDVSEELRTLVMNMILPDPDQRIKKMEIVIKEIRRILKVLKGRKERPRTPGFPDETPPSTEGLRLP